MTHRGNLAAVVSTAASDIAASSKRNVSAQYRCDKLAEKGAVSAIRISAKIERDS